MQSYSWGLYGNWTSVSQSVQVWRFPSRNLLGCPCTGNAVGTPKGQDVILACRLPVWAPRNPLGVIKQEVVETGVWTERLHLTALLHLPAQEVSCRHSPSRRRGWPCLMLGLELKPADCSSLALGLHTQIAENFISTRNVQEPQCNTTAFYEWFPRPEDESSRAHMEISKVLCKHCPQYPALPQLCFPSPCHLFVHQETKKQPARLCL